MMKGGSDLLTTAFANGFYLSFACHSSFSVNNSQCDNCAAADEEESDPQHHIAVISGLRRVGISRLVQLCEGCLGIVECFLCIRIYKGFLIVGKCIVGIVSRLDCILVILGDILRQLADKFFDFFYIFDYFKSIKDGVVI